MKTGTQPLRAVNRIPISSGTLKLDHAAPLAGHASAGLQIHHPKGKRGLASVLHFNLKKPKDARVVLTIHHGAKTKSIVFPFGKGLTGHKMVKVPMLPQEDMSGIHLISVHTYAQRKDSKAKVQVTLQRIDVLSRK